MAERPQTAPTGSSPVVVGNRHAMRMDDSHFAPTHERRLDELVDELASKDMLVRDLANKYDKAGAKQYETEKLLRGRMHAEAECRRALAVAKEAKTAAEAKLAAAEEELKQLKDLHRGEPRALGRSDVRVKASQRLTHDTAVLRRGPLPRAAGLGLADAPLDAAVGNARPAASWRGCKPARVGRRAGPSEPGGGGGASVQPRSPRRAHQRSLGPRAIVSRLVGASCSGPPAVVRGPPASASAERPCERVNTVLRTAWPLPPGAVAISASSVLRVSSAIPVRVTRCMHSIF